MDAVRIEENLLRIKAEVPSGVKLVAVSKFQPLQSLEAAYNAGQRLFGESRVQEILEKIPKLPKDIIWHFIGHLQTNKVKQLIGKVDLIESVDSLRLLNLINEESKKRNVVTSVLLQVHVAQEETKFGFYPDELEDMFKSGRHLECDSVRIKGLMAMATNTDDKDLVRSDFRRASDLFRKLKMNYFSGNSEFDELSMGMSDDWPIAVEEGANIIRVGSAIFGSRHI